MESEAAVEGIDGGAEVPLGVSAEIEGMVDPAKAGFQVAEDGVDPAKHGQFLGLARADNRHLMGVADFGDAGKASRTVGDEDAGMAAVGGDPIVDPPACEARELLEILY